MYLCKHVSEDALPTDRAIQDCFSADTRVHRLGGGDGRADSLRHGDAH